MVARLWIEQSGFEAWLESLHYDNDKQADF